MNENHIHKSINEDATDLYEILELNVSEPIIFQENTKNQQQVYKTVHTEKNKQVLLLIPKETGTRRRRLN